MDLESGDRPQKEIFPKRDGVKSELNRKAKSNFNTDVRFIDKKSH